MTKKLAALFMAAALAASFTGCSSKKTSDSSASQAENTTEATTKSHIDPSKVLVNDTNTEEGATAHISPMEKITSRLGTQVTVNKSVSRENGANTIELPIADYISEGDIIQSFTFVIYGEGGNINEFKGGCGISVTNDCPAATNEGWYQSNEFKAPTEGAYGEITWNVPADIANFINTGGKLKFGYYWGDCSAIRLDSVICQYTRAKNVPVDGTVSKEIGITVNYNDEENLFRVPLDFLPDNNVPEVITFNISAGGGFGKYNGAFMYKSALGSYNDDDIAVITDSNELQLIWFVPKAAKELYTKDGELMLGFWWSDQPDATLSSVEVKYSDVNTVSEAEDAVGTDSSTDAANFRSAKEIVNAINAGWNLGNTLDSYNTGKKGMDTEIGWGNPRASKEMISSVKGAGFNTIRIPVTWGEHMDGNTIQQQWMDRVKEVVDYAYDMGLFVILDMHHDDYIWFKPKEEVYKANSEKLKAIWTQIAETFKDYDDRLIFEGMNEPRTVGSSSEWVGGTPAERVVVNKYEADFVNTVRETGGKNAQRSLIVTSYAASAETSALKDVIIPDGGNIIMTVHYYAPWKFAEGKENVFDDAGKNELAAKFRELKERFIDNGVPLLIDEFGCVNASDEATRTEYYRYYVSAAKEQGIKCVVWDNGVIAGNGSFGIVSRDTYNWSTGILNAIMESANQ